MIILLIFRYSAILQIRMVGECWIAGCKSNKEDQLEMKGIFIAEKFIQQMKKINNLIYVQKWTFFKISFLDLIE